MTGAPAPNRRLAPRAALRRTARATFGDLVLDVETRDLSLEGIGFVSPRPITPGRRGELALALPGHGGQLALVLAVKVAHSTYEARERFRIGAGFVDLAPEAADAIRAVLAAA